MSPHLISTQLRKTIQAHLANGMIGLQGSDTGLAAGKSFMLGIVDLTPGDIHRMALLPSWSGIDLRTDGKDGELVEAAFEAGHVREYEQSVDMATATLRTQYDVRLGGQWISVSVETWLSRADPMLACVRLSLRAGAATTLIATVGPSPNETVRRYKFRSLCWPHEDYPSKHGCGFNDPRMTYAWHPGHMDVVAREGSAGDAAWAVGAEAAGHGPAVGVAVALRGDLRDPATSDTGGTARIDLVPGRTAVVELYAAFARDDDARFLAKQSLHLARLARDKRYKSLRAAHESAWRDLWEADIFIEGDDQLALQARADLFMLYQNAPVDCRFPVQICGMASTGYYGNCFWDADLFAVQALLPFSNTLARANPLFRRRTLDQALLLAQQEGRRGAHYPWQAGVLAGEDNCPSSGWNDEIHVTPGVSVMMWNHYCATGDTGYLRATALPVMAAVADYLVSRATWVQWEGRYEIRAVIGVQENEGRVDNELYTVAISRRALRLATRAAELLGLSPDPAWATVADRLHQAVNRRTGLYEPHAARNEPWPTRWGDTCAYHLAALPADERQLRDAILPCTPEFARAESELHASIHWEMSFHAIAAARLGDADALTYCLGQQITKTVHAEEFRIRTELKDNDAGPYLGGSGALLQNLVFGCAGLGWTEKGLVPSHRPCLPAGVGGMTLKGIQWHGQRYDVVVRAGHELEVIPRERSRE